jgi:hypothetical protein
MSSNIRYALLLLTASACSAPQAPPAPAAVSATPSATAAATPAPAVASPPPAAAAAGRTVHYDLVLTAVEGKTTTRASFSLDLSDSTPGSVWLMKNVSFAGGNRADVGAKVKGRLTMQGDVPRLDVDAEISALDSTGKIRKASNHGSAATPLGTATVILEATDGGVQLRLTATPTAGAPLEPKTTEAATDSYVLDVAVAHTGPGAPATPTALTLKLAGDTPAIAKTGESVPLSAGDAGASARQDVGTRVKATGHARGASLEVDLDLESSALETATPAARIRKIISHAAIVAPFDKSTTAFTAEEDGHRYTVTLTPHRVK